MSASGKPTEPEVEMLREQVQDLRCAMTAVILLLVIIVAMILLERLDFSSSYALQSSFNSAFLILMMTVPLLSAALCFAISKPEPRGPSIVYKHQQGQSE